jgi:hypothetical protein
LRKRWKEEFTEWTRIEFGVAGVSRQIGADPGWPGVSARIQLQTAGPLVAPGRLKKGSTSHQERCYSRYRHNWRQVMYKYTLGSRPGGQQMEFYRKEKSKWDF